MSKILVDINRLPRKRSLVTAYPPMVARVTEKSTVMAETYTLLEM
jgi:hypothetical protein